MFCFVVIYLTIYLFFTLDHVHIGTNGDLGLEISFASQTPVAYQLLAYVIEPKVALINEAFECKIVDAV